MNELKIFNSEEFGEIRTVIIDGEPWFVGKDIALALGYAKPENAIAAHVDAEDKTSTLIRGSGSNYKSKAICVNESGLYALVFGSKLDSAKRFKRWVTSEVLPAIRMNGFYEVPTDNHAPQGKELLALAVLEAHKMIEEKDAQIAEMKPKAQFADSVSGSNTSILVRDMAKILRQNGVDIGGNRLFEWLREKGYLIKQRGDDWNMPTQTSMNRGLFEIKETVVHNSGKPVEVRRTPKITGKGQNYFVNKFLTYKIIVQ